MSINTKDENTLNDLIKELIKENMNYNNNSKSKKENNKTKIQRNSHKINNSPKIQSKSPSYQLNHQIQVIKSTNNNINNNCYYNLISPKMYILSQKSSYSKKGNKHKLNYNFNNITSKFEEIFKKNQNYCVKVSQKNIKQEIIVITIL